MYRPVEAHENEGPDAGAGGDDYEVLDDLAPNVAERPVRQYEIRRGERNAKQYEQEIGDREIRYQNVRWRSHTRISEYDDYDQRVADEAEDTNNTEEEWNDDTDDARDELTIVSRSLLLASQIRVVARTVNQRHVQHCQFQRIAAGHVPTRIRCHFVFDNQIGQSDGEKSLLQETRQELNVGC